MNSVLRFLPSQSSLRQVVLDVIQPPLHRSSSPSFPGTSIPTIRLPILLLFSIHAHTTSTYTFLHFLDVLSTLVVLLIRSFLILSSLVTPLIHLNILISAISNFISCPFFTANVSAPYIMTFYHSITYFNNVVKPRHGKQTTLACV